MPRQEDIVKENSASIRAHERPLATLTQRIDGIQRDLVRIESSIKESATKIHEMDKRQSIVTHDAERIEKRLDELLSQRWELWKLILSAIVGSLSTLAVQWIAGALTR